MIGVRKETAAATANCAAGRNPSAPICLCGNCPAGPYEKSRAREGSDSDGRHLVPCRSGHVVLSWEVHTRLNDVDGAGSARRRPRPVAR